MPRIPTLIVLVAAAVLSAPHAQAAIAELDPTFGNSGRVRLDESVVTDLDDVEVRGGKTYASGVSLTAPRALVVVRLLGDGTLDPTFGNSGIARYRLPVERHMSAMLDVTADGRVLVVAQSTQQLTLLRLTSGGVLDDTFADNGTRQWKAPARSSFLPPLVEEDSLGRAVVSAMEIKGDGADVHIFRFRPGGKRDATFSDDGERVIDLNVYDWNDALAIGPQDRILLGTDNLGSGQRAPRSGALVRLRTDGGFDDKFSVDGVARFKLQPDGSTWPTSIGISGKGLITAAVVNPDNGYGAVRLRANGSFVRRYGDNGILGFTCFCYAGTSDVVGGRVAISGFRNEGPALAVRLSQDGQTISQQSIDIFPGFRREVVNALTWSGAKLVMVGESDSAGFAARVL